MSKFFHAAVVSRRNAERVVTSVEGFLKLVNPAKVSTPAKEAAGRSKTGAVAGNKRVRADDY